MMPDKEKEAKSLFEEDKFVIPPHDHTSEQQGGFLKVLPFFPKIQNRVINLRGATIDETTTIDGKAAKGFRIVVDDGSTPSAPSGLAATAGIQVVLLEWTANSETDLSHYEVWRHTSDVQGSATKIAVIKTNYMVDGGLTGGQAYYYWIKAVDHLGNVSGFNASAGVTATPTNVEASDIVSITADKVLISGAVYLSNWRHGSDVTKIDGGNIYTGSITALGVVTAGSFVCSVTGYIRGGQTGYDTGDGWWLGYDVDTYKFSIKGTSGDFAKFDGIDWITSGKNAIPGMVTEAGEGLTAGDAAYLKASDGKLYKTDASANDEKIHSYKGIVRETVAAAANATLLMQGRITGLSLTFTGAVASTLDWSQASQDGGVRLWTGEHVQTFCTGNYVANIEKVSIYISVNTGDPQGQGYTITVSVYEVDVDGRKTGAALGTKTISSVTGGAFNDFTFASAITVKPRTHYAIGIKQSVNDASHFWNVHHNSSSKNGGMFWKNPAGGGAEYQLDYSMALKTYYTSARYCGIGDNIYLTDTGGAVDYIPGTNMKPIGIILSTSEYLLPHEADKLIEKRGMKWETGTSSAICVPVNAKKAIIQFLKNSNQDVYGEITLINPSKMDGKVQSEDNATAVGMDVSWSGNFIVFTPISASASGDYIYITFLT